MRVELVYPDGGTKVLQAGSVDVDVRNPEGSVRVDGKWHHGVRDIHIDHTEDPIGGLGGGL